MIRNNQKVAIIIVNWNGKHLLKECFLALKEQTYKDFVAILVDNGSNDDSVKYTRENFPWIRIIPLGKNYGFAKGNNFGINKALSYPDMKYIVTLNNDTKTDPNWLFELVYCAEKNAKIGACGSKILFYDNPNIINSTGMIPFLDGQSEDRGIFQKDIKQFEKQEEVFGVNACATLYRAELLRKIGLFDPDYFMYCEDTDLAWRIRLAGYKAVYVPTAKILHKQSISSGKFSDKTIYYVIRNGVWNVIKNFSVLYMLKSCIYSPVRLVKLGFLSIKKRNFRSRYFEKQNKALIIKAILKGYFHGILGILKNIPKRRNILKKAITNKDVRNWFEKYSMPLSINPDAKKYAK
ncbi:MAG: glycosyltransferase family 2 protein [Patescibacteria group bacterium]